MGSNNFFSKMASYDPLAHALHLPGANKYAQAQTSAAAGQSGGGPFAGVTPTLAQANAGYAPGTPGANQDWKPFVQPKFGNSFQNFASGAGATGFNPSGKSPIPGTY